MNTFLVIHDKNQQTEQTEQSKVMKTEVKPVETGCQQSHSFTPQPVRWSSPPLPSPSPSYHITHDAHPPTTTRHTLLNRTVPAELLFIPFNKT